MSAVLQLTPAEEALVSQLPEGAAKQLRQCGLPGRRTEEWRWSDLRSVLKEPIALSDPFSGDVTPAVIAVENAIELVFANGELVRQPVYLPPEIQIERALENPDVPKIPMAALAGELVETGYTLNITGVLSAPIVIRYLSDGAGMHQTRMQMNITKQASAQIMECHESDSGSWLANNLVEYSVGAGACLTRLIFQREAAEAVNIATGLVGLGSKAKYHQTVLGFGGKLARVETRLVHAGKNAKAVLNGAYLLSGQAHLDNTTTVEHRAVGGVTEELYKGVLRDRARGVFQGKFFVARDAQRTDAKMSHHSLLLSETAEVNAKPELEIYADDVQCAHGNTTGALDDEALFYMRQRGLSENEARAMLVDAFVGEVLDGVDDEGVREQLYEMVRKFMGGNA